MTDVTRAQFGLPPLNRAPVSIHPIGKKRKASMEKAKERKATAA